MQFNFWSGTKYLVNYFKTCQTGYFNVNLLMPMNFQILHNISNRYYIDNISNIYYIILQKSYKNICNVEFQNNSALVRI